MESSTVLIPIMMCVYVSHYIAYICINAVNLWTKNKWYPGAWCKAALLYVVISPQSGGKEEAVVASSTFPKGGTMSTMRTLKQWSRLPREVVQSSSLDVCET